MITPNAIGSSVVDTDIVINEVFYLGNTAATDWIELKNVGASTVDVSSWLFCARFSYNFSLINSMVLLDGDDLVMAPGEIIRLQSWTNMNNASSDLGLYSSTSFSSPAAMVDFVQWGTSSDVGRTDVAVAKGIWTQVGPSAFDFTATASAGQSAQYDGNNDGGGLLTLGTDYVNADPTPGEDNVPVPVASTTWGQVERTYE